MLDPTLIQCLLVRGHRRCLLDEHERRGVRARGNTRKKMKWASNTRRHRDGRLSLPKEFDNHKPGKWLTRTTPKHGPQIGIER